MCPLSSGGLRPAGPPCTLARGAPRPPSPRVGHSLPSLPDPRPRLWAAAEPSRRDRLLADDRVLFLPGGFAPPDPPARSLVGPRGPTPLAWVTRCARDLNLDRVCGQRPNHLAAIDS